MSEQRFTLIGLDNDTIKDNATKECYFVIEYVQRKKLVDLLNEQQDKITELQEKSDKLERQLRKATIYIVSDTCSLSEAKLREVIDEIKNA